MYRITCIFLFLLLVASCTPKEVVVEKESLSTNFWAEPELIPLGESETSLYLPDYFSRTYRIDRVSTPSGLIASLGPQKQRVGIAVKDEKAVNPISVLEVFEKGNKYELLLKKSQKIPTIIRLDMGDEQWQSVSLVGEMNAWDESVHRLQRSGRIWEISLPLAPACYAYHFLVDGEKRIDPSNERKIFYNKQECSLLEVVQNGEEEKKAHLTLDGFDRDNVYLMASGRVAEMFVYWNNQRIRHFKEGDNRYRIAIPAEASELLRSHIKVFAHNGRVCYNELNIPIDLGRLVRSTNTLTRNDHQRQIVYSLLVDRFSNGDFANDYFVSNPNVEQAANFHGGDLNGVLQKMNDGYFSSLNVNTICLSPLVANTSKAYSQYAAPHKTNSAYLGSWPISSTQIEERLGEELDLENLVADAHKQNFNVWMDWLSIPFHEGHPIFKSQPDWKKPLDLKSDFVKEIMGDGFLSSLDYEQRVVQQAMSDSAIYWLRKYDLDGLRHAAANLLPQDYWRTVRKKLKTEGLLEEKRTVFQMGESMATNEQIKAYQGSGKLNSMLDLNLYQKAVSTFANEAMGFEYLAGAISATLDQYGYQHKMGNPTGHRSLARFISYADGSLSITQELQRQKAPEPSAKAHESLRSLTALMMTLPGIPVLFYGDEIGLSGGAAPDNHKPMKFVDLNIQQVRTFKNASALAELRMNNMALLYGDFVLEEVKADQMIFTRRYFDDYLMVFFNKSDKTIAVPAEISPEFSEFAPEVFGESIILSNSSSSLLLEMAPRSFEILIFKR